MEAMILAAGRGERLRPLTDKTPKPLLIAAGKPLIQWHIEALQRAGFDDIVINHAWLGEQIEAALGDGSQYGVRIVYSPEGAVGLETGGGINRALPMLEHGLEEKSADAAFLVVNGDIATDVDFRQLPRHIRGVAHLVMVPNPSHHPRGDFVLKDGQLYCPDDNAEKSQSLTGKVPPRLTFSGIGLYRPELFDAHFSQHKTDKFPLAPLLRQAMQEGRVSGELHTGAWLDVGTEERLSQAGALLNVK